jgi:hypothetical protein
MGVVLKSRGGQPPLAATRSMQKSRGGQPPLATTKDNAISHYLCLLAEIMRNRIISPTWRIISRDNAISWRPAPPGSHEIDAKSLGGQPPLATTRDNAISHYLCSLTEIMRNRIISPIWRIISRDTAISWRPAPLAATRFCIDLVAARGGWPPRDFYISFVAA